MPYLVRTLPRAEADLEAIFLFIRASSAPLAERWFLGLLDAIESLNHLPHRNPAIHEDNRLRHLLYGKKPHMYRVIYLIDEERHRVEVLHVRHHGRAAFREDSPQ